MYRRTEWPRRSGRRVAFCLVRTRFEPEQKVFHSTIYTHRCVVVDDIGVVVVVVAFRAHISLLDAAWINYLTNH